MAENYFAPIQNAMAQGRQNALTINQVNRQRAQDERQNMMDQWKMSVQDEESRRKQLEQMSVYAQRILSAPKELQPHLYDLANQQVGGGRGPAWDQGGVEITQQYAALAEQPKVDYQLKQNAQGEWVRIPTSPGADVSPTGIVGETGKGKTTVNIDTGGKFGTIPPGYVLKQAPDGGYTMEPIPGGPAAKDAEKEKTAAEMKKFSVDEKKNLVLNKVDEALDSVGLFSTGFLGQISKGLGGSPAYDLSSTVNTIQANLGFDKLQAMRDASPTGGALGQVSERELALLTSAVSSLDIAQSKEQLVRNLKQIRDSYRRWAANQQQAMKSGAIKGAGGGPGETPTGPKDLSTLSDDELLKQLGGK